MEENKNIPTNLFPYFLSKDDLLKNYSHFLNESWEHGNVIAFYDTDYNAGLCKCSDIICAYDNENKPIIITERIFRKNYSLFEWYKVVRRLKTKYKQLSQEYTYYTCITYGKGFVDYTHYKQWWWECVKRG